MSSTAVAIQARPLQHGPSSKLCAEKAVNSNCVVHRHFFYQDCKPSPPTPSCGKWRITFPESNLVKRLPQLQSKFASPEMCRTANYVLRKPKIVIKASAIIEIQVSSSSEKFRCNIFKVITELRTYFRKIHDSGGWLTPGVGYADV